MKIPHNELKLNEQSETWLDWAYSHHYICLKVDGETECIKANQSPGMVCLICLGRTSKEKGNLKPFFLWILKRFKLQFFVNSLPWANPYPNAPFSLPAIALHTPAIVCILASWWSRRCKDRAKDPKPQQVMDRLDFYDQYLVIRA